MTDNKTPARPEFEVLSLSDDVGAITETVTVVKRRALRIDVKHFDPPVKIGSFGMPARSFKVKNVAELGASFFTEGANLNQSIGQELICQMTIGNISIPLRGRLLYLSRELAGMEFIDPTPSARLALRTHFFFEFGVVGLGAAPKVITQNAGRQRKLAYGSTEGQGMEVLLTDGQIQSFKIGLAHIGAEVTWVQREPLRVLVSSSDGIPEQYVRNQLVCFLRNVRGLNPIIRKTMETVFTKSQMDILNI